MTSRASAIRALCRSSGGRKTSSAFNTVCYNHCNHCHCCCCHFCHHIGASPPTTATAATTTTTATSTTTAAATTATTTAAASTTTTTAVTFAVSQGLHHQAHCWTNSWCSQLEKGTTAETIMGTTFSDFWLSSSVVSVLLSALPHQFFKGEVPLPRHCTALARRGTPKT